ncbi:MAG: hypothetical protein K0R59_2002 [Sphingobacterium sp.]|jgi:hypothetical protein|nr:hypothetical protein [Sphingobacterium sp.]
MSGSLISKTVKILSFILMIAYTNSVYSQNILRYTRDKDFTIETLPNVPVAKMEKETVFYTSNGVEKIKTTYIFNKHNRVVSESRHNETREQTFFFENKYLNDTVLMERRVEVKHPLLPLKVETIYYTRDSKGNITKQITLNNLGECTWQIDIAYNEQGDPIHYMENDGKFGFTKAEYDYTNDLVISTQYDQQGTAVKTEKGYISKNGKIIDDNVYDTYGNFLSSSKVFYEYKYDKYGNWISATRFQKKGKEKKSLEKRKITYSKI